MAALNSKLLKDTQDLVRFYNTNPSFRELFNQLLPLKRVRYQGRPLKFYVKFLTTFSPRYKPFYNRFLGSNEVASELFTTYYRDPREYNKLQTSVRQSALGQEILIWGKEDHQQLEQIDFISDPIKKESAFETFINKKDKEEGAKPETISPLSPITPISQVIPTSAVKNLSSKSQILFKKLTTEYSSQLMTIGSGGVGAIFGGVVLGPPGALAGATGGFLAPSFLKNGGGELVLKGGVRTVEAGSRAFSELGTLTNIFPAKWIIIGIFLALFILPIFLGLLKSSAPFAPIDIAESAPIESPGGGGGGPTTPGSGCPSTSGNTTASCRYLNPSVNLFDTSLAQSAIDSYINKYSSTFISAGRGDLNEFKRRVAYIVDSAKQGGLNPAIFLGYWKTESLFSTVGSRDMGCAGNGFTEEVNCALGIREFSDPAKNPIANCARSRDASSVACRTLKSLRTTFDRTNPINYPVATFDDFAEAYGPYEDRTGGQPLNCMHTYNILVDTAEELGVCRVTSPVSPPAGDLRLAIKQNFNLDFQGSDFDNTHLQWAWDILSKAKQKAPKFFQLIGDITVKTHPSTSERIGSIIYFSTVPGSFFVSGSQIQFQVVLMHELGHVVRGTPGSSQANSYDSQLQQAVNQEGYLTGYGQNPCYAGTIAIDEDFAETISYYINEGAGEQNLGCGLKSSNGKNPLESGNYPAHLRFIETVLK